MNDTTRLMDDAAVIARLRSALDEVATTATETSDVATGVPAGFGPPAHRLRTGEGFGAPDRRRWLAVAAATAVLVGATAWALTGRHPDEQDPAATVPPTVLHTSLPTETEPGPATTADPTQVPASVPASVPVSQPVGSEPTSAMPTTTTESNKQPPWFTLTDPGLTAEPSTRQPVVADGPLVQSWTVTTTGGGRAFVTVDVFQGLEQNLDGDYVSEPVEVDDGTAFFLVPNGLDGAPLTYGYELRWYRSDGSAWLFRSQGLTKDEMLTLVLPAVPGSGLPVVLPDPSATFLTTGIRTGAWVEQTYTGEGLNGQGTVQVRMVDDGTALDNLVSAANIVDVTIAGTAGWAAELGNGAIEAVWDAGSGWWGVVTVSSQLARGADGIFASVQPADPPS